MGVADAFPGLQRDVLFTQHIPLGVEAIYSQFQTPEHLIPKPERGHSDSKPHNTEEAGSGEASGPGFYIPALHIPAVETLDWSLGLPGPWFSHL